VRVTHKGDKQWFRFGKQRVGESCTKILEVLFKPERVSSLEPKGRRAWAPSKNCEISLEAPKTKREEFTGVPLAQRVGAWKRGRTFA